MVRRRRLQRALRFTYRFVVLPWCVLLIGGFFVLLEVRERAAEKVQAARTLAGPDSIDVSERLLLGDAEQWIQIRGTSRSNPLLLVLHGGPGDPVLPQSYLFQDAWEEQFTVVHWDQRGAGKTYAHSWRLGVPASSGQLVDDAEQLTRLLLERFGQDRLVLMGWSWGTYIGVQLLQRAPELYSAYVGVGQVVDMLETTELQYDYVTERGEAVGDWRLLERLRRLGPPPYDDRPVAAQTVLGSEVGRLGGRLYDAPSGWAAVRLAWERHLVAPGYSTRELLGGFWGTLRSMRALRGELAVMNVKRMGRSFEVPMFFFQGRHDWVTPSPLVERYAETLEAPAVELVWFERSAHAPLLEQSEEFARELGERVLPWARGMQRVASSSALVAGGQ